MTVSYRLSCACLGLVMATVSVMANAQSHPPIPGSAVQERERQPSKPVSADGSDHRTPGAIIAEGVAQIVRDHEEANWQDLAVALHLPELADAPATWSGPFAKYSDPRFTALYTPRASSLGITEIEVEWRLNPPLDANGRPTVSRMLTVALRSESCPTPAEMTAATGSPERHITLPGPDAGPKRETHWFDLKDSAGKSASILYATKPDCELTAFDKEQW